MTVNNEIGVIQPIKEIGKLCRSRGVYFHTDAAQALGKIKLDVNEMNIDLMSMSGHKIYGPKGVGAIYIRRKPRVKMDAQIHGGGQERGYRSGTLAVPVHPETNSDSCWSALARPAGSPSSRWTATFVISPSSIATSALS